MKKIIIAGGGTGGHIYPALTIAKAINKISNEYQVEFVGTEEGLEAKIIPKEGFNIRFIKVGKLNYSGSFLKKIATLIRLPWGFIKCLALVIEKKPVIVLGVGGYVSGPFVLASSILGVPTALWEPNAHPGLTNRLLARFVRKCFVVFEEAKKTLKSRKSSIIGLPVREEIENLFQLREKVSEKKEISDGNNKQSFKILIFGGSQGARALNKIVKEMILSKDCTGIEFIHQTGKNDFAEINMDYVNVPQVRCFEYLYQINENYLWCDLVICRSGAGTVAELAAAQRPAILVPLPWAADDHQKKNAQALVDKNAGIMIEQKDLSVEKLYETVKNLKNNYQLREEMSRNIKSFFQPRAAIKIAEELINLQYENVE